MKRVSSVALLCSLALAACGGGNGGGSVSPPVPAPSPTSTPSQTQANIRQVSVQRALAQQSMQTQQVAQESVVFSAASPQWTASAVRRDLDAAAQRVTAAWRPGAPLHAAALRREGVTYSACSNGMENGMVNVSSTEVQMYERQFYDAACTKMYRDMFIDLSAVGTTGANGTGTITEYAQDGTQTSYDTLQLAMTAVGSASAQITLQLTSAPNASAPQVAALGLSCGAATSSASCGAAAVAHEQSLSQDLGASMLVKLAETSSNVIDVTVSGNAEASTGALNSISIAPDAANFPAWTLSSTQSMTQIAAVSLSGQFAFTPAGVPQGGAITASDSADDGTASIALATQGISGSIKQTDTGSVLATFSVDDNGNGSITYSDGSTAQIADWQISG